MTALLPTILLAEDDPDDAFLLQRALRKASFDNPVVHVHDGVEATDYLAGAGAFDDREVHPLPAVILLDLKMPRRSGFEVLAWLRDQPSLGRLPVVVLTSSRESADVNRAYELGANSYLVKPGSNEDLLEIARTLGLYWLLTNEAPEVEA